MSGLSVWGGGAEGLRGGSGPTAEPEDWVGVWGDGVGVESVTGTQSLALRPQQMAAEQPRLQGDPLRTTVSQSVSQRAKAERHPETERREGERETDRLWNPCERTQRKPRAPTIKTSGPRSSEQSAG